MRKWTLFLGVYFVICMLAACAFAPAGEETPLPPEEQPTCGPGVPYEVTCRIVDGAETGQLLLAELDGAGIYTLNLSDVVEWKADTPLKNGQLLTVRCSDVLETWPGQFREVREVLLPEYGFDDRCALYLRVLEDLWAVDSGLNDGVEFIGVDLAETSLSPSEQAAVGWAFAGSHGAECITGTLEELIEQGWVTATPLSSTGSGADLSEPEHYFYHWETGCHFSVTEQPLEGSYSLVPVTFDAMKWRSSLGAYFFSDCTAVQSALGEWSDYTVGSEMIS